MKEQQAFTYPTQPQPIPPRRSATQEEITARYRAAQQNRTPSIKDYPPASPHRVGHFAGIHPEDAPYSSQEFRQVRQQPAGQRAADEEEPEGDYFSSPRSPTSAIRYPTAQGNPRKTRVIYERRFRSHWLLFVGVALFVMILGWLTLSALESWWQVQQDDWHYGRPRTFQTDAVVGHNDSQQHPSHFIAMNLNHKVIVIELPGGDPSKAHIYIGPTLLGDGQDLIPVTVSFQDENNHGKPDMLVHVGDQVIAFLNKDGTFVAPQQQ